MADDVNDEDEGPSRDLFKVVKDNSEKFSHLQVDQQEIWNQLWLLTKKFGKQSLHDGYSNQNDPEKLITQK